MRIGEQKRICVEGRNCWQRIPARRAAFLIDGAAYFAAFAAAVEQARESIFIVGWDINSRVRLLREERQRGLPTELKTLLNALVVRRRDLHIYILVWDFALIYALERELLPVFTNGWQAHRRVHFAWDGRHPVGASHHQKIVVVDHTVAFVGGLDLTRGRWDTPGHNAKDPHRTDENGQPYPPFHDVQIAVEGDAAMALGQLVRERWKRATGHDIRVAAPMEDTPWPPDLHPDLTDVRVAIARTEPAYGHQPRVHEIEVLYGDAIAAARHGIYIENQYLTSGVIGESLAARLQEPQGPDVVLVLPLETSGWLEKNTMDVLRGRILQQLREADRFNRLRIYYPSIPGGDRPCLTVHAKILVVDNRLMRVGSSNLSNRSMGLDTECDVAIETNGEARIGEAIAFFRNRLLGEHLGVSPEKVAEAMNAKGSLAIAIDTLCGGERTLKPLEGSVPEWLDQLIPESAIFDPERPVDPDTLITSFGLPEDRQPGSRALVRGTVILLVLLGLAAVWRWTPVAHWIDADMITRWAVSLREAPGAPLIIMAAYLVGSVLLVPVTALIVATAFAFGPWLGFVYSIAGCLLAAMVTYSIGALVGRDRVRSLAGSRLNRLSQRIARHGLLTVVTVRVVPVAPFTVVNMVAGASHIRSRDFFWGTGLGMAPGILAITLFEYQLEHAIRNPGTDSLLLLAGLVIVILLIAVWARRWFTQTPTAPERTPMGTV